MRPTKPEPGKPILVEISERVMEIKFPLRVLKQLDVEHGISVLKGAGLGEILTDPDQLAVMLYYGLKTKQEDVTIDWIQDNVDAAMLLRVAPLLMYACTGRWPKLNLPDDDEEDEDANPMKRAESRLTGLVSGQSDDTTSALANPNFGT